MTTFTPGPWTVSDNHGKRYIEPVGDNEPVAMICRGHADAYLANADLIAAAPELYHALDDLFTDMIIAQGNMRDAAKRDTRWEGCAEEIQPRIDAARAALAKARGSQ
ncbi:hypothetical protein [Achromobacter marplatensis]|uniref:hypothetical protein n=1 Tax=Achromobacter marplatensis TaxID=470868 RepID=UPI0028EA1403|nr:hypothetical protein [Achromobacter marplatensis]